MANSYRVKLCSAADDGTNTYCVLEITDGTNTMPQFQVTFPTGTTASVIKNYMQTIANNQPTIDATLGTLVSTTVLGA